MPDDYITVTSGLGEKQPKNILVMPFVHNDKVTGVIEIGSFEEISELQATFLEEISGGIAIAINSAQSRQQVNTLLEETQQQAADLQTQQEELKSSNEELEEQTQLLKQSEAELKSQQEELQVTNEELEEKTESLQSQKSEIEQKNNSLEQTRQEIEMKAEELALASKYKSEFLANMSHELRTPLNSLLLLANSLADNKDGNLTEDQVESSRVISESGQDLLSLIEEILDLAKIEAGRMDIRMEQVLIQGLADRITERFQHMAEDKSLKLKINIHKNTPEHIRTDRKRIEQIIKNLLSNAIKFTNEGGITVEFNRAGKNVNLSRSGLAADNAIAISVKDTGIGIPTEKQKVIFEAFQQVDGGIAREYGGTGLGLSISRELAKMLGGEIQMNSELDKGTTFVLYLPPEAPEAKQSSPKPIKRANSDKDDTGLTVMQKDPVIVHIADDRDNILSEDKTILVVEDDPKFAKLLLQQCHQKGFKCLASPTGEKGLELVEEYHPNAAILDIKLPGMDGWSVLESLKDNPKTRHIPVHIVSAAEEEACLDAFRKGAVGYLKKPIKQDELKEAFGKLAHVFSRKVKDLLVVEDDKNLRNSVIKLIGNGDVQTAEAATGKEAIEVLKSKKYDCMILDLGLPDMTGFQLLKKLEAEKDIEIPPVIVYTGKDLTQKEEMELHKHADTVIIKGVKSEERLLDETSLFLHRVVDNMPARKRKIISNLHDTDFMFRDKKVLIVDDDMRTVFALSRALEDKGLKTIKAEDGRKALEILDKETDIDIVLMDIMMPVMDGYETMKKLRSQVKFKKLPIIALTAKAMKGDNERCISAGASDYLPKPVDLKRLVSMMRVWMYR